MKKKAIVGASTWLGLLLLLGILYTYAPNTFSSIEKNVRDLFFTSRGSITPTEKVIIVDIDEKSLAALGQWPWGRNTVSQLIEQLSKNGAGIIGLDIVFAEADKTSPAYINKKMNLKLSSPLNYDDMLGRTLSNTPTIAGYVFNMEQTTNANIPQIPAIIIERGLTKNSNIPKAQGVIPNIETLQKRTYSSGFFNIFPDKSGMVRTAPMLIRYDERLYPSLPLEMIRLAMQEPRITVEYNDDIGVENIKIGTLNIPVNNYGELSINFRGPSQTFTYISAIDVLDYNIETNIFKDKFVLIGSSAIGLLDLRSIPLDNVIAGVEIHANIIDNILSQDFLYHPAWIVGLDILIFVCIFSMAFFLFLYLGVIWLSITALSIAVATYFSIKWTLFHQGILIDTVSPFLALLLALFAAIFINYIFETRQKKLIKMAFAKKVSTSVVEELMSNTGESIMKNREEEITILFSDIRDFTAISEKLDSPQDLINLLNLYITPMTDIILKSRGTIDKFIGDSIMAYWNAPQATIRHADAAVTVALLQLKELKTLNKVIKQRYGIEIEIGIGINTGKAIVGEVGSEGRSDYTVIGDSVNIASRIEGLNKIHKTSIIISEDTKKALKNDYNLRELEAVRVKGKSNMIRIYEVLGEKS